MSHLRRSTYRPAPQAAWYVIGALTISNPLSGQAELPTRLDSLLATVPVDFAAAPVPFGPGELLEYKVKVGLFGAGSVTMAVEALDTVRNNTTYRASVAMDAGLMGVSLDDRYTTWMDIATLQSWRYIREIDSTFDKRYRHYEFYPDERLWKREDNGEEGPLASAVPLDEMSFIYFLRQMPLEVGKTYTLPRYFKEDGNPVVIEVLRRDRRETEGVWYDTIVVKPTFQTSGLFGEGGNAELHFSDDERRLLVYLKVDMPVLPGSLTWHLRSIDPGAPLHPNSRASASN